jgi:hypothetical protein
VDVAAYTNVRAAIGLADCLGFTKSPCKLDEGPLSDGGFRSRVREICAILSVVQKVIMRRDQHAGDTGEKMMWRGRLVLSLAFCILGTSFIPAATPAAAQDAALQKSPSEAATVVECVTSCDHDSSQCEHMMRMAVLDKLLAKDATSICMTDVHPQKPVIAWLRAHPETYKMATEDGLYTAYKNLYPCS